MPLPSKAVILLNPDPGAYLPHRFPFLMLDRVLEQQPGHSARARYRTSGSLPAFPQTLLVEVVAQLSGIATVERQGDGGFLAAIEHASFGRSPQLGETLEVSAKIVKSFGRLCLVEGTVRVAGEELLNVTLTLGIGPL